MTKRYFAYALVCAAVCSFLSGGAIASAATITDEKVGQPVGLTIPDTDLEVSGCVAPNSLVTVLNDGAVSGAISSDDAGQYSQLLSAQSPTIHVINTSFEDDNGVRSSETDDLVALTQSTLTRLTVHPAPTIVHSPDPVVAGSLLTFRGFACPNTQLSITVDGNTVLTTRVGSDGRWVVTLNSLNFTQGTHTYSVTASGPGYVSSESDKYQFTVLASSEPADSQVVDEEVDVTIPVVITSPKDGFRSGIRTVLVSGTGPPNAQIEVFVDGVLVGSVFSNAFGEWSLQLSVLGAQQSVTARACNRFGCDDISPSLQVFYGLAGEDSLVSGQGCSLKVTLGEYRFNQLAIGKGIDLDIHVEGAQPRFDATVDWGDVVIGHQTMSGLDSRLHHAYATQGFYNGSVAVQTQDGTCKDVVYFSVRVTQPQSDYRWAWYPLAGLLSVLFYQFVFIRWWHWLHRKQSV